MQAALAETVTGIYCGWARIGSSDAVYQMVMSIGYNPFYNNTQKTAEAWLLHTFQHDFYGAPCWAAVRPSQACCRAALRYVVFSACVEGRGPPI